MNGSISVSCAADQRGQLRFHRIWLSLGIGLSVAIVWLSLTPRPIDLDLGANSDKLEHLTAYGSLMFWFCMVYPVARRQYLLAPGFCAMGVGIEFLQGMTSYRTFEWADMVANCAGVAVGWCIGRTPLVGLLASLEKLISRYGEV